MIPLVDVHAHLDHESFKDDLDEVIENSKKEGVKIIVANGVNPETNRVVLEYAKKYDIVKAALGLYPIDALQREIEEENYPLKEKKFDIDSELKWVESQKDNIVGIGEVGLDYKMSDERDKQKETFQKIIELCERINKPIIVHSRKAENDVVEMLESSKLKKIVLHCFCGKIKLAKYAADKGWSFSIPTNIVRLQHFQQMVELININQLLTETDCPYLGPFVGKRNEPKNVIETIKIIAKIKDFTVEETANNVLLNYQKMFL